MGIRLEVSNLYGRHIRLEPLGFDHLDGLVDAAGDDRSIFRFTDVPRGKPAPDLFLSAAAAEGVDPMHCVVIEDSTTGARAAAAAGMDCLGYLAHGDNAALRATGAVPFCSMFDLPSLIRLAPREFA